MNMNPVSHTLHSVYDGGVYLIVAPLQNGQSVVKIGRSMEPVGRFAQLLPGIPFPCKMYYLSIGHAHATSVIEKKLHRQFKARKTRGEWFLFGDDERDVLIDALKEWHHKLRPSVEFKLRVITTEAVTAKLAEKLKKRRPG